MGGSEVEAGSDAYVRANGSKWTLGSASVERTVSLNDGKFLLESFKNKLNGKELKPAGTISSEIAFSVNSASNRITGASSGWKLVSSKETVLKQGEHQLDITLQRDSVQVTKSYVIYPKSSVIREWVNIKNAGKGPVTIIDPGFLNFAAKTAAPASLDFHWMTGGECKPQAWNLKTEKLAVDSVRKFDSYEPMAADSEPQFAGNGVNARILLNDKQVWPESGWTHVANSKTRIPFDIDLDIKAGDTIVYVVNAGGGREFDTTEFNPSIAYADGSNYTASDGFSEVQGKNGWHYGFISNDKFEEMVFDGNAGKWRREGSDDTPWIASQSQHPDSSGVDVARKWTATKSGNVHITGDICNVGNEPVSETGAFGFCGFRMGSSSYAPWTALQNTDTGDGLFIGWDYFGRWKSSYAMSRDGAVNVEMAVANYKKTLQPGQSITTPKAFVGLFTADLDNAGNECLDWQYRYMWQYTRDEWFPAVRMLGYWFKGTPLWMEPGLSWADGNPDEASLVRKVFRMADLMRYCGGDVYHRDWGWWHKAGDWDGPDWNITRKYLSKSDMKQLIYAFMYTVSSKSKVATEHPDWCWNGFMNCETLDMSQPPVVNFIKNQLDEFVQKWGTFEWRNDSIPMNPRGDDDTPQLGQDQGLRDIIRSFVEKHPDCSFQAVNCGGNGASYEYASLSSTIQFSDGAPGRLNYYGSLLFPPDKTSDIPEATTPDGYDKATYRGKLSNNLMVHGDSSDPQKLEGVRELIDIYHYLHSQQVVGRWVKVYRPIVTGDDPVMYFQRLSGDRLRSILIPKHTAPSAVTIKPKGLLPKKTYFVSFQESSETAKRTGDDLMKNGIRLEKMLPGELIYLNLPMHPGNKLDKEPPTAPSSVKKNVGENMGYPGVEVTWKPAKDNGWLSYYEIIRDGIKIDKVAKGCYYFDHSAGADVAAAYEIKAVDGAGNASASAEAKGAASARAKVYDDAAGSGIVYSDGWTTMKDQFLAHAGTLTRTDVKGATAELDFEGRKVLLFVKMGADCGKVSVSVDGSAPEIVDTYSADDLWGMCVWQKELASGGQHSLKIEVLGEHSERSSGNTAIIDGIRVEP